MEFSKISREFRKGGGKFNIDLAFILAFYDAYLREHSMSTVAGIFHVTPWNLKCIIERNPELQLAVAMADENRSKNLLGGYVVSMLSPEMRRYWEKMTSLTKWEEIDLFFKKKPTRIRQQLFCHAVVATCWDNSKACGMVGIRRGDLEKWKTDPEFLQMLEEVQFHKKNFLEKGLYGLIAAGHPGAILFANRTLNADRGYSERLDLNVAGREKADWDLNDLGDYLDLETQKKILAAIERKKADEAAREKAEEEAPRQLIPAKVLKVK